MKIVLTITLTIIIASCSAHTVHVTSFNDDWNGSASPQSEPSVSYKQSSEPAVVTGTDWGEAIVP